MNTRSHIQEHPVSRDVATSRSIEYFNGDSMAANVFIEKYALRNSKNELIESTPDDMHRRLAFEFYEYSKNYPNSMSFDEIYSLFENFEKVIPQGSPMSAIGNPYVIQSTSNCFVIHSPVDSYGGIFYTDQQQAQLMKRRGGVGFDITNIRPKGEPTSNSAKVTDGIAVFMDRFSNTCREVAQGGRRGALMLTLSVHHPEIETFINIKRNQTRVTGSNISIRLSDEFMNAVKSGSMYTVQWPVDSENPVVSKQINARIIWNQIVRAAWESAEPGVLFWDHAKKTTPSDIYESEGFGSTSTNPCQPAWATVLTPNGIRQIGEVSIGDLIWSIDGWSTVVNKVCTGVKKVYKYSTECGVFYGTENHIVISNGKPMQVKDCVSIDPLKGPRPNVREILDVDYVDGVNFACGMIPNSFKHVSDRSEISDSEILNKVKSGSTDKVVGFLRGMFEVRGSYDGSCASFKNLSECVSENIQEMLSSVGISSVRILSDAKFEVCISVDTRLFLDNVCLHRNKLDNLPRNFSESTNELAFSGEVFGSEFISEEYVYDITVDNKSHTYWTGGLNVHNCGEIVLSPNDSCRLMAINLYSFVENKFTSESKFNYDSFADTVYKAQHLMDSMVDIEISHIDKIISKITIDSEPDNIKQIEMDLWKSIRTSVVNGRRTGLGITGLGDTIAAMGVRYGSNESIEITEKIYKTLAVNAYRATIDMAETRGAFKIFDYEKEKDHPFLNKIISELGDEYIEKWKKYGRRNIALTTTAPTGSVSVMTGTTSGIEPAFSVSYVRRRKINPDDMDSKVDFIDVTGDKYTEYKVFHKGYKDWMDTLGKSDADYEESPYFKSTANDIDWVASVDIQSAAQRWVCHSISKTCNLPNSVSEEVVSRVYMDAWEKGCKGFTVYRDGCRSGVLLSDSSNDSTMSKSTFREIDAPKRPSELPCEVNHVEIGGHKWIIFVGMYMDRPYEVFGGMSENIQIPKKIKSGKIVKSGKKDGRGIYSFVHGVGEDRIVVKDIVKAFANVDYAFHTLAISGLLRSGMGIQYILDIFNKADEEANMFSFNKVVARVLKHHIKNGTSAREKCQECGAIMMFLEGCKCCTCGYSKC